jgi:hypothetical protein
MNEKPPGLQRSLQVPDPYCVLGPRLSGEGGVRTEAGFNDSGPQLALEIRTATSLQIGMWLDWALSIST